MAVSFNSIPNVLLTPGTYIEYDNSRAVSGLAPLPNRMLLIGSMHSSGSADPEVPKQILREGDGGTFFGVDSQLGRMCKKAKKANKFVEMWAIGLEDADGAVAATKTVTLATDSGSAGTLHFLVHGERVPVPIASGDTPGAAAIKFANKIAAGLELLYSASFGMTAVIGGTPEDGNYDLIFTGFGLESPVTVRVERSTTPSTNDDLAAAMETELETAIAGDLAGVVLSASSATATVSFTIAGGLATGTVTEASPGSTTITLAGTGVATLTCKHAAAFGNDLDVRLNYFDREDLEAPAGMTVAIAAGTSGTTDPDIGDALTVIGDEWYVNWVSGYNGTANILATETELDDRWGPMVQQDAWAFYGLTGTHNEQTTIGDARNSQFTVLLGTGESPTPPWEVAAVTAAVSAGEPDPGRPRQTLPLPNILPPAKEDLPTLAERNLLLQAGISTFKVDDGGRVLIERLVTSYKTNASSLPDPSYRNLNTMLLLLALRFTTRARIAQKYPRHKLADDGTAYGPGQAVVTPSVLRGEMLTLFEIWEERAWVQNFAQFAEELIMERNADDRDRMDALLGPNLINQFRVMAAQFQFLL